MPHRDPQTGKFVAGEHAEFDDIEVVSFTSDFGVAAANLDGSTGFGGGQEGSIQGVQLIDYDEFMDRNQEAVLLSAYHRLITWINSTQTADGTLLTSAGISSSPVFEMGNLLETTDDLGGEDRGDFAGDFLGDVEQEDTIDLLGRRLKAVAHGPITDGATGVGGGGSAGFDDVEIHGLPEPIVRYHPRDDMFLNIAMTQWNVDDAGIHGVVEGQHVYGMRTD